MRWCEGASVEGSFCDVKDARGLCLLIKVLPTRETWAQSRGEPRPTGVGKPPGARLADRGLRRGYLGKDEIAKGGALNPRRLCRLPFG